MPKKLKTKPEKPPRRPKFRRSAMVLPLVAPPGITDPRDLLVPTGIKRATANDPTPSNLGKRVFFGGGLNKGEKPRQAAAREAREESGILVTFLKIRPLRDRRRREQATGALFAIRTFHLARAVGGTLKKECNEVGEIRYERVGWLLDNSDDVGPLHSQKLKEFLDNGSLEKALHLLQVPTRPYRKK